MQFYWLVKLSLPPHNIIALLLTTFSPITFSLTLHRRQKTRKKIPTNKKLCVECASKQTIDCEEGWGESWVENGVIFYIKSIFSVHFLASPSDPCCLSTTVHPNHSTHPSCSFFFSIYFFLCTFRRRKNIFFVYYLHFYIYSVAVCESGLNIFFIIIEGWKNLLPLTHTQHFFLFNLYFLMYREKKLHLSWLFSHHHLFHNAISQSCVFTIHSSASLKNCLFYYIFHNDSFLKVTFL